MEKQRLDNLTTLLFFRIEGSLPGAVDGTTTGKTVRHDDHSTVVARARIGHFRLRSRQNGFSDAARQPLVTLRNCELSYYERPQQCGEVYRGAGTAGRHHAEEISRAAATVNLSIN